jgi:hypothetical protein
VYFPDTAVFIGEISRLKLGFADWASAPAREKGLLEIELASRLLRAERPGLAEIPEAEQARVAGLPTEEYRRRAQGSGA